ncbi:MAG: hypothetical protein HY958_09690 [Bacteroidia bacterium]|nr:hypothetical protein [Bacteroidia bacterium]
MKRLSFIIIICFPIISYSQLFVQLYTGYGFKLNQNTLKNPYFNHKRYTEFSEDTIYNQNIQMWVNYIVKQNINIDSVRINLGAGLHFGGSVGYMFNKYFGTALDFSFQSSDINLGIFPDNRVTCYKENIYYDPRHTPNHSGYIEYIFSGRMLSLVPSAIFQYSFKKFTPFVKIGLNIGSNQVYITKHEYMTYLNETNHLVDSIQKERYWGDIGLRFNSSIGCMYNVNSYLSIFLDCNLIYSNFKPTKGRVYENIYYYNGDSGNSINKKTYDVSFVDKVPQCTWDGGYFLYGKNRVKMTYPFSSFGINVGVSYSFGKRENQTVSNSLSRE